jgi:hypothetical protein
VNETVQALLEYELRDKQRRLANSEERRAEMQRKIEEEDDHISMTKKVIADLEEALGIVEDTA